MSFVIQPGLYIVATPIGNLQDITFRAVNVLRQSDYILCENVQISKRLLNEYSVASKLLTYSDNMSDVKVERIIQMLKSGSIISMISDAGTPLISDPGYKLIRSVLEAKIHVDAMPGPSSIITALILSNFPPSKFLFLGFIPKTPISKRNLLERYKNVEATWIILERATRVLCTVQALDDTLDNPKICVARELTKIHQELYTGTAQEIIDHYTTNPLKGECIILVSHSK